jgi:hypothetical protein
MKTPNTPDKLHHSIKTNSKNLSNPGSPLDPATVQSQSNLNRRGRKTRTAVTAAEVIFCAYFVLTGNVKQASLQAGYSAWWGYELLKMPRIQSILREFEKRKQDEGWATAKGQIVLSREFLDELFIQRLVNMKTHPKVGDLAIVKMFETGYKRTGDIQPASNQFNNQNNNAAGAFAGQNTAQVIYANWKIEEEQEQVRRALEEEQRELTDGSGK